MERVHLVLVPGLLCTDALWQRQIEALTHISDVRVTQQHLRHATCEAMADAILAECPSKFAIAGSSTGGYLALLVANKGGDRVSHLCLINTPATLKREKQIQHLQEMLRLGEIGSFNVIKEKMTSLFLNTDNQNSPPMRKLVEDMANSIGLDRFTRQLRAFMESRDLSNELPNVNCSTLVLCGGEDSLLPVEFSREIAKKIPRSKFVTIREAAHLLPAERPSTTAELMEQWLTDVLPMDGEDILI